MKIRLLKKEEIPACAKIVGINYSKKYQKTSTFELSDMFGSSAIKPKYFVAEDNKQIIGFAGFIQSWMDYNIYQIFWVNVLPNFQRKGVGKSLVAKIILEIKKNKNANLILLTADAEMQNDAYYRKNFNFKSLETFDKGTYRLMSLSLEK